MQNASLGIRIAIQRDANSRAGRKVLGIEQRCCFAIFGKFRPRKQAAARQAPQEITVILGNGPPFIRTNNPEQCRHLTTLEPY
jgi:hypothetical protein